MSYVYRVLNAKDHSTYLEDKCFKAKKMIKDEVPLIDALTEAPRHIFGGSDHDFGYISVSRSLTTVLEKYSFARNRPGFNDERPLVAIIENNDEATLKLSHDSTNPLVKDVEKVVIDYSDDKHYLNSMHMGLVYSAKKIKYDDKKPKPWPGYKYARKSRELVVLNKILGEDIKYILNPLEIDLLYAILKAQPEADVDDILNRFALIKDGFLDNLMTYEEYYYCRYLYLYNHFLEGLIPNEEWEEKVPDVLELTAILKEIKRGILAKILAKLGFDTASVPIVEDYAFPIRKGEIPSNRKLDTFALYDDEHVPLEIPALPSHEILETKFLDFEIYRIYDFSGDDYYILNRQNRVLKLGNTTKTLITNKGQKKKAS